MFQIHVLYTLQSHMIPCILPKQTQQLWLTSHSRHLNYDQAVLLFAAYVYGKLYVTNSMEQGLSSEANSHSASQEIPHLLWNLKAHYCVHNSLLLVPILSQKHMRSYT
jgi:hypothetical protein